MKSHVVDVRTQIFVRFVTNPNGGVDGDADSDAFWTSLLLATAMTSVGVGQCAKRKQKRCEVGSTQCCFSILQTLLY
jgi:hypothetical protein